MTSAPLADGTWYFHLRTVDNAGNWTSTVHLGPFYIDTTAPTTTLSTNPVSPDGQNGWFKTTPSITLSSSEPGTTYYQWDSTSGSWTSYSSSFTALEGQHTLYYYSTDQAGNSEGVKSQVIKVDTVAPSSSISTTPPVPDGNDGWFKTKPAIALTIGEPGTAYYQWDTMGGQWNTYSTPFEANDGQHTLYYYAVDTAGNEEPIESRAFKVDSGAPSAPSLSGSAESSTRINLSWSASSDAISGISHYGVYNADNGSLILTTATTNASINGLNPQTTYNYYVKAFDVAGNSSAPSNTISVSTPEAVDSVPPSAPSNLQAVNVGASNIKLSWNDAADNISVTGYEIFDADTNQLIATTSATSYTIHFETSKITPVGSGVNVHLGMQTGLVYRYYVKARDAAGNVSAASNIAMSTGRGLSISFSTVTGQGLAQVTIMSNPPAAPSGVSFKGSVYDITTNADYAGPITVAIPYDSSLVRGREGDLKLYHYEGGSWRDVTTQVDANNDIIYGEVSSLSPFAIGEPATAVPASSAPMLISLAALGLAYAYRSLKKTKSREN